MQQGIFFFSVPSIPFHSVASHSAESSSLDSKYSIGHAMQSIWPHYISFHEAGRLELIASWSPKEDLRRLVDPKGSLERNFRDNILIHLSLA